MFLILLIYHLIHVFFDFPGDYCRNYTVLIQFEKKMVTLFLDFKHKKMV